MDTEQEVLDENPRPNPGSPEAQIVGCRCPVMDNLYGRGFFFRGEVSFWFAEDCPLHGAKATPEEE